MRTVAPVLILVLMVASCGGGPEASFGTGPDAFDMADAIRDEENEAYEKAYDEYRAEEALTKWDDEKGAITEEADYGIEFFTASVNLNIRSGQGTSFSKVGLMSKGERCEVFSHNSDDSWLEVYCDEKRQGWVSASYGELQGYDGSNDVSLPSKLLSETAACVIKGNVSYNTQERIYHLPTCPDYDKTVINANYGESWFCTESEAKAAGWRKASNCP